MTTLTPLLQLWPNELSKTTSRSDERSTGYRISAWLYVQYYYMLLALFTHITVIVPTTAPISTVHLICFCTNTKRWKQCQRVSSLCFPSCRKRRRTDISEQYIHILTPYCCTFRLVFSMHLFATSLRLTVAIWPEKKRKNLSRSLLDFDVLHMCYTCSCPYNEGILSDVMVGSKAF